MENVEITGWRAIEYPRDSLQTDTDIDNLHRELLERSIMEVFVLHEHHVSKLQASHEVFN
jgi:hypothetical protein